MTRKQKIALAVAIAILIPAGLLATATYCVIDVHAGADDGFRIFAPVPLALIEATLWLTPTEATRFQDSELAEYQALLLEELPRPWRSWPRSTSHAGIGGEPRRNRAGDEERP